MPTGKRCSKPNMNPIENVLKKHIVYANFGKIYVHGVIWKHILRRQSRMINLFKNGMIDQGSRTLRMRVMLIKIVMGMRHMQKCHVFAVIVVSGVLKSSVSVRFKFHDVLPRRTVMLE